jgi:hypothetical protein
MCQRYWSEASCYFGTLPTFDSAKDVFEAIHTREYTRTIPEQNARFAISPMDSLAVARSRFFIQQIRIKYSPFAFRSAWMHEWPRTSEQTLSSSSLIQKS